LIRDIANVVSDQSDDIAPPKKRNLKTIILLIVVVSLIAVAAAYSLQSRNSGGAIASLSDMTLAGSRFTATITNDGADAWDVDSVQIGQVSTSCIRLPKGVEPGDSATFRCSATVDSNERSVPVIVTVKDSAGELHRILRSVSQNP
jgi:hypothetical protein